MILSKPVKAHYSEVEAAEELGVTVEQLRSLIRAHVIEREEDLSNLSIASFQPSDLLLLRFLTGGAPIPLTQS